MLTHNPADLTLADVQALTTAEYNALPKPVQDRAYDLRVEAELAKVTEEDWRNYDPSADIRAAMARRAAMTPEERAAERAMFARNRALAGIHQA